MEGNACYCIWNIRDDENVVNSNEIIGKPVINDPSYDWWPILLWVLINGFSYFNDATWQVSAIYHFRNGY